MPQDDTIAYNSPPDGVAFRKTDSWREIRLPKPYMISLNQRNAFDHLAPSQRVGEDSTLEFFLNNLPFAIH